MIQDMTVSEIRSTLAQMNITKGLSGMRKAELIETLEMAIEHDHDVALEMNAEFDYQNTDMSEFVAHKEELVKSLNFPGMTFKARVAAYKNDNGRSGFLTARQQRRAAKKFKSAISKGYSLDVVMGS